MDPRGRRVLILGDSLSAASWAPGGALAAELRKAGAAEVRVDARVGRSAVNLWNGTNGENGATIAAEAARRPDIVVVFLGTNDAASGVSAAADEAGFRRIVATFAPGTEWWVVGPPAFPKRPDIEARAVPVYATLARVFGPGRVLDARPLTPATGRKSDGVHFTALGGPAFGRVLAAALVPAAAPTSASASAIAPFTVGAWRWTLGGAALAALGVGLAVVIRRRRQLGGSEKLTLPPVDTGLAPDTRLPPAVQRAQVALERMGWSLTNIEINEAARTARVELKRADGRYLTFDVRNGKATLTREQTDVENVATGRRGDRARVDRLHMRFLGRNTVGTGLRDGMRKLVHYLDDNSLTEYKLGRDAMVPLLDAAAVGPVKADGLGAARRALMPPVTAAGVTASQLRAKAKAGGLTAPPTAFDAAKVRQAALEAELKAAKAALAVYPRGPMGLTPDAVKALPEYRTAKVQADQAFARLRAFNATFVKTFAKELREERATRRPGLGGDDYRMDHRPSEDGPPLHDLLDGDLAPRDIYDQPQWYTGYDGPQLHETVERLRFARGRPERKVWIFRAAPRESGGRFNAGDWVSLSRTYGMNHAKHPTDPAQDTPVYAAQVPASTVRWAGDDLMEFGYWGPPVKGKVSWSRRVRRKAAP